MLFHTNKFKTSLLPQQSLANSTLGSRYLDLGRLDRGRPTLGHTVWPTPSTTTPTGHPILGCRTTQLPLPPAATLLAVLNLAASPLATTLLVARPFTSQLVLSQPRHRPPQQPANLPSVNVRSSASQSLAGEVGGGPPLVASPLAAPPWSTRWPAAPRSATASSCQLIT